MTRKTSLPAPDMLSAGILQLLVEVEFGVPSRQCANYGICRIEAARAFPKAGRGRRGCGALALASAPEERALELAFLRNSLAETTRGLHFGGECFRVEEPYPLPSWLCEKTGLPPLAVDSGRYRILKGQSFFVIRFCNLISL